MNATLLGHDLTLEDLYAHYASPELAGLPTEGLLEADRAFYAGHRNGGPSGIVGADSAANAVRYALRAGLLEADFGEDLERAEPFGDTRESVGGSGSSPLPAAWATSGSAPSTAS